MAESLAVAMDVVDPDPERLVAVEYLDGRLYYFATGRQHRRYTQASDLPSFEPDVKTRVVPDNGRDWWRETRDRVEDEPILEQ